MTSSQIFTLLGIILGSGGVVTVAITAYTSRRVEAARTVALSNSAKIGEQRNDLESQKVAMDGLSRLAERLQVENDRKDRRIAVLERTIERKDATITELTQRIHGKGGSTGRRGE